MSGDQILLIASGLAGLILLNWAQQNLKPKKIPVPVEVKPHKKN